MSNISNISNVSVSKKPFKTRFQVFGWLFGAPLVTFDNLLPIPATTSTASTSGSSSASKMDLAMPTEQNVMQHFIHLYDERRDSFHLPDKFQSSIIWDVADNLIAFWQLYSPTSELR